MWIWLLWVAAAAVFSDVDSAGAGAARLVCYVESARSTDSFTKCTHLVYTGDARGDKLDALLKEYRKSNPRLKIVLRVTEIDKDLRKLLKSKHVQGLELYEAHKTLNRTKVLETVEDARAAISASGGGPLFLALPAHPELLAKYYDLRVLIKKADLMMVQTHALGLVKKMTYHPSRLSGMWDMMNTDSVVDLVVGLGVPASKVVISLPATARKFTLLNESLSTPGSPTSEDEPKEIDQAELCRLLQKGRWTLERDQDLSAPYAFKNSTWISFEDASSVDVKGKYARVRGLAGLALHQADKDMETPCGPTLKASLNKVLNQQSRAPRAAVLRSLEHEILSAPVHARALDALQVSPYRITQVVDSDGVIHSIREDTRTEFSCSRQGYFVHPRSCARFYRCVKFDQLSPEYTVFEFDCPAGLAFDSRYEVCVWPGSIPHTQACPGSSEIAPVPQTRFVCPEHEGYYADPENCRWFFACLDHGKAPLTAYEFRCPFGLGFDAEKLKCDWPWLVPACGNIARYEAEAFGFSAATLTGAAGFQGKTADAINVAAHQSLVSGASLNNLVGIQGGFLTNEDALNSNFIASQEIANGGLGNSHLHDISQGVGISHGQDTGGLHNQVGNIGSYNGNVVLVQPTNYNEEKKYTSGSLILDDYRYPTAKDKHTHKIGQLQLNTGHYTNGYNTYAGQITRDQSALSINDYNNDNSGAYVHDPSGDYAEPYRHVDSPAVPYVHDDRVYKDSSHYYESGTYSDSSQNYNAGKYVGDNNGENKFDQNGVYVQSGLVNNKYNNEYSGSYNDNSGSYINNNSGKYVAGVYRADGQIGNDGSVSVGVDGKTGNSFDIKHSAYNNANTGSYISDSKAYTGASHTLTAGAINVGLVGKTTLVDAGYSDQFNYQGGYTTSLKSTGLEVVHETSHPNPVSYVSRPAVLIKHAGTDSRNLDGYSFVTTPTSSGVPTTATPYAVTTAIPITTFKTQYVPEVPKSNIKQVLYNQPAVTYVHPTVVAVKEQYVTPKVEVTDYNQDSNYQYDNKDYSSQQYNAGTFLSQSSDQKSHANGYEYSKPSIKFEDGLTHTTPTPIVSVSTYKPQGFSHNHQTIHKVESVGFDYSTAIPVTEKPFKELVAYTTGPSVTYTDSESNIPHSYGHQTVPNIETSNVYTPTAEVEQSGYEYTQSNIAFEEPKEAVRYTTVQPAVVSTYQPQGFSHQTLHEVDASHIKTYSHSNSNLGYEYQKPKTKFEEIPKTVFEYSTSAPVVSTYKPQSYSHETIHKIESQKYEPISSTTTPKSEITYQQPAVSVYENPISKYIENVTPVTYVEPTYKIQAYSHQTIHKAEDRRAYTPSVGISTVGYEPSISYGEPQTEVQYTTTRPIITAHQVSTPTPQVYSHETFHKVDASKVHTYSHETSDSGYEYQNLAEKFEEGPKNVYQYSTPAPVVTSTFTPQTRSHQIIHNIKTYNYIPVSSTPKVELTYKQPEVTVYENPILKYTENVTPVTFVKPTATVYTQTYQPVVEHKQEVTHVSQPVKYETNVQQSYSNQNLQLNQAGYTYGQPEIQRDVELNFNAYSNANVASQQEIYQSHNNNQYDSGKDIVFVSTTPATLAYEKHYAEYESPKRQPTYKAPEYVSPKSEYEHSYSIVSTGSPSVVQHKTSVINKGQAESYYEPSTFSQEFEIKNALPVQQVSYSTSHITEPRRESIHLSTFPGTKVTTKYNQQQVLQESPEVQVGYNAEEYIPPVVSTPRPTDSTYKSRYTTAYTTKKHLPPAFDLKHEYNVPEYLPPKSDNTYLPPTTTKPIYKSTTQPTYKYVESTTERRPNEYLPPTYESSRVVNFESYGLKEQSGHTNIKLNPYLEYTVSSSAPVQRKQNIVVEKAKSNLLGFGTVGPDAGLVSPVTYTTSVPIVVSQTSAPYKYSESISQYKAPEYLPPTENAAHIQYQDISTAAPIQRQQNIVVETAKSHLLGFGTVGPDAGLVSSATYTTSKPYVTSTENYSLSPNIDTSTYEPVKQEIVEVKSSVPIRTKPKVAIVTKINDFNPLLVKKLGAVCSCQSPVLVLKGKRPNVQQQQEFDDYNNDYDDFGRGDINKYQWSQRSNKLKPSVNVATSAPIFTSTFNPIIVPDDSYYQDYQDSSQFELGVTPKSNNLNSKKFISSTPAVISTTEKIVRIKPRVTAVTVAPTYKTVLLNQEVTSTETPEHSESAEIIINSQAFDRYGPGGWRSRDETLQGSVDCQRAGLFRHPKQCNKFYACRWDCTKQRFTLHVFNCPVQLSFDPSIGACNWPSQGPACQGDTLLTNNL